MADFALEYLKQEVESADPARLTELLFARAVRDLQNARELWNVSSRSVEALHHIGHAQKILLELQRTLDLKQGGEFAVKMNALYTYIQARLAEASTQSVATAPARIEEVLTHLTVISETWSTMATRCRGGAALAESA